MFSAVLQEGATIRGLEKWRKSGVKDSSHHSLSTCNEDRVSGMLHNELRV